MDPSIRVKSAPNSQVPQSLFSRIKAEANKFRQLDANSKLNESDENEKIQKLKSQADKAFTKQKYDKAYSLYKQALSMDSNNYEIIACLIGAALNLGYMDEVFEKSDCLIKLNPKRAQGYFLKGMAHDVLYQFEQTIELFIKALEYEVEHRNTIVKNLTKTILKYSSVNDSFQLYDESNEDSDEVNLVKLVEAAEKLLKRRKFKLVASILQFVQSLDSKNYVVKSETLMCMGKLFKCEESYQKALLAFEECLYLANLNDDYKQKINALISISTCHLQLNDLHRVIVYFNKLIDIEADLLCVTDEAGSGAKVINNNNKSQSDSNTNTNSTSTQPTVTIATMTSVTTTEANSAQTTGNNMASSLNRPATVVFSELFDLDLRIAIRQNLFTAHYRLGKLRICCYYLLDCMQIIDEKLCLNDLVTRSSSTSQTKSEGQSQSESLAADSESEATTLLLLNLFDYFDFIQIKFDACIELFKLYKLFGEFAMLQELAKQMLEFVEALIELEKAQTGALSERQVASLRQFRLKAYAYLAFALAGQREFRYAKLCVRKSLCLIDREIRELKTDGIRLVAVGTSGGVVGRPASSSTQPDNEMAAAGQHHRIAFDMRALNLLKVECLVLASETYGQFVSTFKEMCAYNESLLTDMADAVDRREMNEELIDYFEKRVEFSRRAYTLSKQLIDPSLRTQTTFGLAQSLFDSELYQSAAYYFQEVLSISTLLTTTKSVGVAVNSFSVIATTETATTIYTDAAPDYHLESTVYLIYCELLIDYYEMEPLNFEATATVNVNEEETDFEAKLSKKSTAQNYEELLRKADKASQTIGKQLTRSRANETLRTSFIYNRIELEIENLKADCESERLRRACDLCADALAYICHKLGRLDECVLHLERADYLLNDLDRETSFEQHLPEYLTSVDGLKVLFDRLGSTVIKYKFILNKKLLACLIYEPASSSVVYSNQLKISQIVEMADNPNPKHLGKLVGSEIDYLVRRFDAFQNEWVKKNLTEIESRDMPGIDHELRKQRDLNKSKDRNFRRYLTQANRKNGGGDSNLNLEKMRLFESIESIKPIATPRTKPTTMNLSNMNYDITQTLIDLFVKPIQAAITQLNGPLSFALSSSKFTKLLAFALNSSSSSSSLDFTITTLGSYSSAAHQLLASFSRNARDEETMQRQRDLVNSYPQRAKSACSNDMTSASTSRLPEMITPRLTSNPKLAVVQSDEKKAKANEEQGQRIKNRLDAAVGTLISQTISGTNVKCSYLEVLDFRQVHRPAKCCVIGCPDLPTVYERHARSKLKRFLTEGFDQLREIADMLYTRPIFGKAMTKHELLRQLDSSVTNNNIVYLSTYSSNDSDASCSLVCSECGDEYPSSAHELDKYCKVTEHDLDLIDMHACTLLILNCYSVLHHRPRLRLAHKFLMRGCKSVLVVLSPLPTELLTKFYAYFFGAIKSEQQTIGRAYSQALAKLVDEYKERGLILSKIIRSSIGLLCATSKLQLSLKKIATSSVQANIDDTLARLREATNVDPFNMDSSKYLLTNYFRFIDPKLETTSLERSLVELQILFKFLLTNLARDATSKLLVKSETKVALVYLLYDLITKAITNIKNKKIEVEPLNELIDANPFARNFLACLGFQIKRATVVAHRDQLDKKFITFPEVRYLDLNLRAMHIMSSLIEMCFEKFYAQGSDQTSSPSSASSPDLFTDDDLAETMSRDRLVELRIKTIVCCLQSLLPIEDKNLITCLIDILALTQISADIVLSVTDFSVAYALNYYEKQTQLNSKTFSHLIEKDLDKWYYQCVTSIQAGQMMQSGSDVLDRLSSSYKPIKFSACNKALNFLLAIGYEIVGQWLRFIDIDLNRKLIELLLKLLTSFALDRDMSLYKELNIDVIGRRSATIRSRLSHIRSAVTTHAGDDATVKSDGLSSWSKEPRVLAVQPWCSVPETRAEMKKKVNFVKKFLTLSKSVSEQRLDALKHHLDHAMRQHEKNVRAHENDILSLKQRRQLERAEKKQQQTMTSEREGQKVDENENQQQVVVELETVKFKPGGNPARDRVIVNEKYKLSLEQINQIRQYSHYLCHRSLEKIETEYKEKAKNLLLPFIKENSNNN